MTSSTPSPDEPEDVAYLVTVSAYDAGRIDREKGQLWLGGWGDEKPEVIDIARVENPNEKNDDGSYVLSGDELRAWWAAKEQELDREDLSEAMRNALREARAKVQRAEAMLLEAKAEEQSVIAIAENWQPATRPDAIDWSEPATTSWNSESGYNTDAHD